MKNFKFNDAEMFMDIAEGTALIIDNETGIYYGMNAFGTVVFEALAHGMDAEDLKQELMAMDGAPTNIGDVFDKFLNELLEKRILVPYEGTDIEICKIDVEIAKADDYQLEITAYDDAQEMLLADPIHEVKEDTGWTPDKDSIGYTKEETREREKQVKE